MLRAWNHAEGDDSGDLSVEPSVGSLGVGEAVAASTRVSLGRRARSRVRVRIVGIHSLAWVEAVEAWGVLLEVVVAGSSWVYNKLSCQFTRAATITA